MDRILIVDADTTHAAALTEALISVNFLVEACRNYRTAINGLQKQGADIVVVVPGSSSWWRNDLKSFCDAIRYFDRQPQIVCVLRWPPHGPNDRLFGEELNVEVIHEW